MLMEYITRDLAAYLMEEEGLPMDRALDQIYSSEIFAKLTDPETGLYLDSSPSIISLYMGERKAGHLVQNEV